MVLAKVSNCYSTYLLMSRFISAWTSMYYFKSSGVFTSVLWNALISNWCIKGVFWLKLRWSKEV